MLTPAQVNEWRVIPRLLVMMYGFFAVHVGSWFMSLPDPTGAQSAFVSTIWGAAAAWFGFYCNSGSK
jgi:hypothetical protein